MLHISFYLKFIGLVAHIGHCSYEFKNINVLFEQCD